MTGGWGMFRKIRNMFIINRFKKGSMIQGELVDGSDRLRRIVSAAGTPRIKFKLTPEKRVYVDPGFEMEVKYLSAEVRNVSCDDLFVIETSSGSTIKARV